MSRRTLRLRSRQLRAAEIEAALDEICRRDLGAFVERFFPLLNGGREFWHGVQQSLIRSAGDGREPDLEEQAKTVAALRVLIRRFQPYADDIKPIFDCVRPSGWSWLYGTSRPSGIGIWQSCHPTSTSNVPSPFGV